MRQEKNVIITGGGEHLSNRLVVRIKEIIK